MNGSETDGFERIVNADGVVTHVIVPIGALSGVGGASIVAPPGDTEIDDAIRILNDPSTEWHDAEEVLRRIVVSGIGGERAARGMTQQELADVIGLSQAQVSRLEKDAGSASLRVLRRIAEALRERERDSAA